MNTRQRLLALQRTERNTPKGGLRHQAVLQQKAAALPPNPACVPGSLDQCRHPLVDRFLNAKLYAYEKAVRARFEAIEEVLRSLSPLQHERDFVERAQRLAREWLQIEWPVALLENAWVAGADIPALYAHAIFATIVDLVRCADRDRAPWIDQLLVNDEKLRACGIHTIDVTPCADGRLQGLLPFVLRTVPSDMVFLKPYAGALFDVESDIADWTQRALERRLGILPDAEKKRYVKVVVYHFSSSHPTNEGCAAHGSNDAQAIGAAIERLEAFRTAITSTFGWDAAPLILLVGLDTDLDAIRIHLPDSTGKIEPDAFLDAVSLYRETYAMSADEARAHVERAVSRYVRERGGILGLSDGIDLPQLALYWLLANFSQIEYVIEHHKGRYEVIGHDECFICVGEALPQLQLRNLYYHAHLETVEEGSRDLDVGVKIFHRLNLRRGLPLPVVVHFTYSSLVPGSRQRAIARGKRVAAAIVDRYRQWHDRGLLHLRLAVSDRYGQEAVAMVSDDVEVCHH